MSADEGIPGDPTASAASEEELRAAIEEQLRQLRVSDVILQSLATLMSLAGRRLGLAPGAEGERDLDQARLAIDGARALVGLVDEADAGPIREALSQIQLAYARVAGEAPAQASEAPKAEPEQDVSETERAKARAKIWTPPGA